MHYKIKVDSRENHLIQAICFNNGGQWENGQQYIDLDRKHLYIKDFDLFYGESGKYFEEQEGKEISATVFLMEYQPKARVISCK